MTNEQKKNCSTLNDLCNTVKSLDDRLVSEHTDRVNTELQLQLDFDSKVTQNTNQLRNELSQEIEAVNSNIKTEVNKAIASVVDEAPESFDTLKEAADWIQTHGTEAAAMQSAITNLENNLTQEVLDRTTQLSKKQDQLSSIQLRHSNDFININSNNVQAKQCFKIAETEYRSGSFDTFQLMGFASSVTGNNERNYIAVNFVNRNSDYHSMSGVLQKPCKDWDIEVYKNENGDKREIYFVTSNAWVSFNGYCVNYTNNGTIVLTNLPTATTPTGTLIGKLSESTELQIVSKNNDKLNVKSISMVDLGFTKDSTVSVTDFVTALYNKFGTYRGDLTVYYRDEHRAYLSIDGTETNKIPINGGFMHVWINNISTVWTGHLIEYTCMETNTSYIIECIRNGSETGWGRVRLETLATAAQLSSKVDKRTKFFTGKRSGRYVKITSIPISSGTVCFANLTLSIFAQSPNCSYPVGTVNICLSSGATANGFNINGFSTIPLSSTDTLNPRILVEKTSSTYNLYVDSAYNYLGIVVLENDVRGCTRSDFEESSSLSGTIIFDSTTDAQIKYLS